MTKSLVPKGFLLFLMAAVIYACYQIFKPFLAEFLIATILVTIFYTPYEQLVKLLRDRRNLASLIMCFLIILLVIVPLINFLTYTAQRSIIAYGEAVTFARQGGFNEVANSIIQSPLLKKLEMFGVTTDKIKEFVFTKMDLLKASILTGSFSTSALLTGAKNIVTGGISFIVSIAIVIFSMFFFFVDGKEMVDKLMYWTPLSNKHDKAIFKKFKDVSYSTIISTFITAIAQGIIGAIGFLIVGFPAFFTSIAMAFASIIPYVGTALIWLPVSGYLLVIGKIWQGVFLLIWGGVIISNSDNLIRTYLIKDKAGVHPLFVLFAILGGLSLFGFWGIIFGPLIISLAITIFHIYELEYEEVLEK